MQKLCLTIARFALSAWIGAAALFVVTSVREATFPAFDSLIKNQLAALRFPSYYLFGFVLVGLSFVCGTIGLRRATSRWRWSLFVGTSGVALLLMVFDYIAIFQPLYASVTRPDGVRDHRFMELHRASTRINFADVSLCSVAAILACWPNRKHDEHVSSAMKLPCCPND